MTKQGLRKMIAKFQDKCLLSAASGRGRQSASVETEGIVALALEKEILESTHSTCRIRTVARRMDAKWSTVYKSVCNVFQFYQHKIRHVQELQRNDPAARVSFALEFLAQMKVGKHFVVR